MFSLVSSPTLVCDYTEGIMLQPKNSSGKKAGWVSYGMFR